MHGLYVCPDVDIAMYTLAGVADSKRGWGVEGDTHFVLGQLKRLRQETWFKLGDRDIVTSILRTSRMRSGLSLTAATLELCRLFGVEQRILPITDDPLMTYVSTPGGEFHFQEFWVKERGRPAVRGVRYKGASKAAPTAPVARALESADRIVLCPANPVTSIGPILAVKGVRRALARSRGKKVALSPMVGSGPVSGPAGKLLRGCGLRSDSLGIAGLYRSFLDSIVIDKHDERLRRGIERLGLECVVSDTVMHDRRDERRLAEELMAA